MAKRYHHSRPKGRSMLQEDEHQNSSLGSMERQMTREDAESHSYNPQVGYYEDKTPMKKRRSEQMSSHYENGMDAGMGYRKNREGTGDTTAYHEVNSGTGARGMIHTEPSQHAGLPQDVKMLKYPKTSSFMPYGLNWGIEAEDHQMAGDQHQIRKQVRPRKA